VCFVRTWGLCVSLCIYIDSRARKETGRATGSQQRESMSAKKPGAREYERKSATGKGSALERESANAKAQNYKGYRSSSHLVTNGNE
jgi:hypothetical protein